MQRLPLVLCLAATACDLGPKAPEADPAAAAQAGTLAARVADLEAAQRVTQQRLNALRLEGLATRTEFIGGLQVIALRQDATDAAIADLQALTAQLEADFRNSRQDTTALAEQLGGLRTQLDSLGDIFISVDDDDFLTLEMRLNDLGAATQANATSLGVLTRNVDIANAASTRRLDTLEGRLGLPDYVDDADTTWGAKLARIEHTIGDLNSIDDLDSPSLTAQVANVSSTIGTIGSPDDADFLSVDRRLADLSFTIGTIGSPDDADFLSVDRRLADLGNTLGVIHPIDDADFSSVDARLNGLTRTVGTVIEPDDVDTEPLGTRVARVEHTIGPLTGLDDLDTPSLGARVAQVEGDTSWLAQQIEAIWDTLFPPQDCDDPTLTPDERDACLAGQGTTP